MRFGLSADARLVFITSRFFLFHRFRQGRYPKTYATVHLDNLTKNHDIYFVAFTGISTDYFMLALSINPSLPHIHITLLPTISNYTLHPIVSL